MRNHGASVICALLGACAATPASRAPCAPSEPRAAAPAAVAERLPAMPDVDHPAFGFLRWPPDQPERAWQPLPCKSIQVDYDSNWPSFKLRSVTLSRDGRAIAHNSHHRLATQRDPEYEGHFEARLSHEEYGLLCYMIELADFWRLDPEYTAAQLHDCWANVITVVGERATRSVRDHCWRAPVPLVAFEMAFGQVEQSLPWKRVPAPPEP